MSEIAKILDILFKQNEDLATIKQKVSSIEQQTLKTNGRLTKAEGDILVLQNQDKTRVIVQKVNWKWLTWFGAALLFFLTFLSNVFMEWLKKKFFN